MLQTIAAFMSTAATISGRLGLILGIFATGVYISKIKGLLPSLSQENLEYVIVIGLFGAAVGLVHILTIIGRPFVWAYRKIKRNRETFDRKIKDLQNLMVAHADHWHVLLWLHRKNIKRFAIEDIVPTLYKMSAIGLLTSEVSGGAVWHYEVPDHIWDWLSDNKPPEGIGPISDEPPWLTYERGFRL